MSYAEHLNPITPTQRNEPMNYYNNGSTGMIRDTYTEDGRADAEAAHSAKMRSAADANVEVFTDTRGPLLSP